jgi:segregation and condensation protein B
MESSELRAALEAILFLSSDPTRVDDLAESLGESKEAVQVQLEEVKRIFDEHIGGFTLEQAAGGWRLTTRAEHDSVLKKYFAKKGENRLSIAALETLAIVAYRQPITAPEVSEIRGVNATGVIRTLLERRMVRVAGRKNVVGSPFLYRTTKDFLVHFGLNDIRDLPRLEEFGDLIGETINDDLVAAINATPEPSAETIAEALGEVIADEAVDNSNAEVIESDDVVASDVETHAEIGEGESGDSASGEVVDDGGTTLEEQDAVASEETQLESSGSEPIEE